MRLNAVVCLAWLSLVGGCSSDPETPQSTKTTSTQPVQSWSPPFQMSHEEALDLARDQEYLEVGGEVNTCLRSGRTRFLDAVSRNQRSRADYMIRQGADLGAIDEFGRSALGLAIYRGHGEMVDFLLGQGIKASEAGVLYLAMEYHPELAQHLIDQGADVNRRGNRNQTPLHVAARSGREDMVRLLLKYGANVNVRDDDGRSPLCLTTDGSAKCVRVLLNAGAEIDLHCACLLSDLARVTELLRSGRKQRLDGRLLHLAVQGGDIRVVRVLLNNGVEVDARNPATWTPLHTAARFGKSDIIRELLSRGAKAEARTSSGETPFMIAASAGRLDAIKTLVSAGADVKAHMIVKHFKCEPQVITAMDLALSGRASLKVVEFLHEQGLAFNEAQMASVQCEDESQKASVLRLMRKEGIPVDPEAINNAVISGQMKVLAILLDQDGIERRTDKKQVLYNALRYAIHRPEVIEYLISHGAPVNDPTGNPSHSKPLCVAAEYATVDVVRVLLAKGASISDRHNNPLPLAAERGRLDIVKLLLACKQMPQEAVRQAMSEAIQYRHESIVREIVASDVYAEEPQNQGGSSALRAAVREGAMECAQVLIDYGAKADIHSAAGLGDIAKLKELVRQDASSVDRLDPNHGMKPIHFAARNGRLAIIELLLEKGVSIDSLDRHGSTPLHYAIYYDHLRLAKWLIERRANVGIKDDVFGRTPLHIAALKGWRPIASLLLDKGADANAQDGDGDTPLHLAGSYAHYGSSWEQDDMCRFLIGRGADMKVKNKRGCLPSGPETFIN